MDLILRMDLILMEVRRAYTWLKYNTVLRSRELDTALNQPAGRLRPGRSDMMKPATSTQSTRI